MRRVKLSSCFLQKLCSLSNFCRAFSCIKFVFASMEAKMCDFLYFMLALSMFYFIFVFIYRLANLNIKIIYIVKLLWQKFRLKSTEMMAEWVVWICLCVWSCLRVCACVRIRFFSSLLVLGLFACLLHCVLSIRIK